MDGYVRLARTTDFATMRLRSYKILGRYVGILKEADGSFRALEMGCKHQGADLSQRTLKGHVLTCPWHGWQYDLRDGRCLKGVDTALRPHDLRIEGEDIYVSLRPVRPGEELDAEDGVW